MIEPFPTSFSFVEPAGAGQAVKEGRYQKYRPTPSAADGECMPAQLFSDHSTHLLLRQTNSLIHALWNCLACARMKVSFCSGPSYLACRNS